MIGRPRPSTFPEWGGEVIIKTMSGAERSSYDAGNRRLQDDSYVVDLENLPAKMLSRCLVGDDGEPLFTVAELNQRVGEGAHPAVRGGYEAERLKPRFGGRGGKRLDFGERFFYFRVAHEVTHSSVEEMLSRISAPELTEWMAYFRKLDQLRRGDEAEEDKDGWKDVPEPD
jgi:hypothetical protein